MGSKPGGGEDMQRQKGREEVVKGSGQRSGTAHCTPAEEEPQGNEEGSKAGSLCWEEASSEDGEACGADSRLRVSLPQWALSQQGNKKRSAPRHHQTKASAFITLAEG